MNKKLDGLPQRDYLRHSFVLLTAAHLFVVNTRDLSAGREHEISGEGMLEKGKGKPPSGHRSFRGRLLSPGLTHAPSSTGLLMETEPRHTHVPSAECGFPGDLQTD